MTTQGPKIKSMMMGLLDSGYTNKEDIYDKIEESMGTPRPTIRRIARDVRTDLTKKVTILQTTRKEERGI